MQNHRLGVFFKKTCQTALKQYGLCRGPVRGNRQARVIRQGAASHGVAGAIAGAIVFPKYRGFRRDTCNADVDASAGREAILKCANSESVDGLVRAKLIC